MRKEICTKCGYEYENDGYCPMDILNDEPACNKCREEAVSKAKYWFRSHIPGCCEGAPRRYITSNDKAEFLKLLQKRCGKEYILGTCKDDHTYLMDVNSKTHWVAGFTNVDLRKEYGLPYWQDVDKSED